MQLDYVEIRFESVKSVELVCCRQTWPLAGAIYVTVQPLGVEVISNDFYQLPEHGRRPSWPSSAEPECSVGRSGRPM